MYESVELCVHDNYIEVWYGGQCHLTMAIKDRGLYLKRGFGSNLTLNDGWVTGLSKMDVDISTYEKDPLTPMAIPKLQKRKAAERPQIKASRASKANRSTENLGLQEKIRDRILDEILKSFAKNPKQTKAEISAETIRIADKIGVGKMQVAGVRANLSRGSYGDMGKLITKKQRSMSGASVGRS